jgi:hypothetical protein
MRILTGVLLTCVVLALLWWSRYFWWPTLSGTHQAPDLSLVLSEVSIKILPIGISIWTFLLKYLPELLFAGAILIFLISIRKYPSRKRSSRKQPSRLFAELAPEKGIELDQPSSATGTTVLPEDFDIPPLDSFKDPDSYIDTTILESRGNKLDSESDSELDSLTEAWVFEKLGRNHDAISLLMEEFSIDEGNLDEIALKLASLFENELEHRIHSDKDATNLLYKESQFLEMVSRRPTLISSETWFTLCAKYPDKLLSPTNIEGLLTKKQIGLD